jgi:tRNA pseudouridine38-40 synthase
MIPRRRHGWEDAVVRLRIDLAYDGGAYHGWARQPGLRTVEGELSEALDTVLRTSGTTLTVAGRTDAGVHARHQVAHADVDPVLLTGSAGRYAATPLDALVRRLNGVLDPDVRIHDVRAAADGFDARFSALWRRYAYRIADHRGAVDPLERSHVLFRDRPLDLERMNRAADHLLGEHDFAAFCRKRSGATTIRTLLDLAWVRDDAGLLVATVRADAFCHSMVRALVGCLVAVGERRREAPWVAEVLAGRLRDPAVTVMRAHGLTLEEIRYPDDAGLAVQADLARVVRTLA